MSTSTQTGSGRGLSSSDKLTIGTSIGFGVPATIAAIISAYYAYLAERRKRARRTEGP
jgi:hypothetical protein